jgi:hypothetical protein
MIYHLYILFYIIDENKKKLNLLFILYDIQEQLMDLIMPYMPRPTLTKDKMLL